MQPVTQSADLLQKICEKQKLLIVEGLRNHLEQNREETCPKHVTMCVCARMCIWVAGCFCARLRLRVDKCALLATHAAQYT
eukprot:2010654-Amphidinium_carterae.1